MAADSTAIVVGMQASGCLAHTFAVVSRQDTQPETELGDGRTLERMRPGTYHLMPAAVAAAPGRRTNWILAHILCKPQCSTAHTPLRLPLDSHNRSAALGLPPPRQ